MSGTAQTGLPSVGEGDVLMRHDYAVDLVDLIELLADILRHGGYGLHEDIADRYPARTVELLIVELDAHVHQLRAATITSTRDTR